MILCRGARDTTWENLALLGNKASKNVRALVVYGEVLGLYLVYFLAKIDAPATTTAVFASSAIISAPAVVSTTPIVTAGISSVAPT